MGPLPRRGEDATTSRHAASSSTVSAPNSGSSLSSGFSQEEKDGNYNHDGMNTKRYKRASLDVMVENTPINISGGGSPSKSSSSLLSKNVGTDAKILVLHMVNHANQQFVPNKDLSTSKQDLRKMMVDYMCKTTDDYGYDVNTAHMAVKLFDEIMHKAKGIDPDETMITAIASLLIASKLNERDCIIRTVEDLLDSASAGKLRFGTDSVLERESAICQGLNWHVRNVTPLALARALFAVSGHIFMDDVVANPDIARLPMERRKYEMDRYLTWFANFAVQRYEMLRVPVVDMACVLIMSTRRAVGVEPTWNNKFGDFIGGKHVREFESAHVKLFALVEQAFPKTFKWSKARVSSPDGVDDVPAWST